MLARAAIALLLLVPFVPSASAAPCGAEVFPLVEGKYYRAAPGTFEIWRETNGVAGLQLASCQSGGATVSGDTLEYRWKPTQGGCVVVPATNHLVCIL